MCWCAVKKLLTHSPLHTILNCEVFLTIISHNALVNMTYTSRWRVSEVVDGCGLHRLDASMDCECIHELNSSILLSVGCRIVVVVAYAFRSHNWSARQRHHCLQIVVWTSHRVVLSVGRIRQYVTSFGSHRRNTGRSLWVSIFFFTSTAVTLSGVEAV